MTFTKEGKSRQHSDQWFSEEENNNQINNCG
jgi:hypothetical protein